MQKIIKNIRGIKDILPKDINLWEYFTQITNKIINNYGYRKVNLPIIEKKLLFQRSIGQNNLTEKEMYNLYDRKNNELVLRPEGTAGCVKCVINNKLLHINQDYKLWYLGPMFRYERPQKGRYRQFHQIGLEIFGNETLYVELELILLIQRIWNEINIQDDVILEINSIGSLDARQKYSKHLKYFIKKNRKYLDDKYFLDIKNNPIKILETKNKKIKDLLKYAPTLYDYIEEQSKENLMNLCKFLKEKGINYKINNELFRGLDYYNNNIFEWTTKKIKKSKITICGGGRYDNLFQILGNLNVPAVGAAIGIERVILIMQSKKIDYTHKDSIDIYFATIGIQAINIAIQISEKIRDVIPNLKILINYRNMKLKKQMQYANKNNTNLVIIIGQREIKNNEIIIKDFVSKKQFIINQNEVIENVKRIFKKNEIPLKKGQK